MTLATTFVLAASDEFQAKNSLLPETLEIIWGGLAFLIVAFGLVKYAGPAIVAGLRARSERIQRELDNAAKAKADAETEAADIRAKLGDIDGERARTLATADDNARRLVDEGRSRLDDEVVDLRAKTTADIATADSRLAGELEGQVGQLAGEATEQLVSSQLDEATAQRLVEEFIAKVGSGS